LLVDRAGALAPSRRERLESWLGTTAGPLSDGAGPSVEIDALIARASALEPKWAQLAGVPAALDVLQNGADIPALTFNGTEIPRLDPARVLVPVHDLDELIDLFARVIEDVGSPEDFERVLEGVSRLCDQRPDDFAARTAPLAARARFRFEARFEWQKVQQLSSLARTSWNLALSWVTGQVHGGLEDERNIHGLIARRVRSISRRAAAQQTAPLLSAPTHAGGWIDPPVLVERAHRRYRAPFADDDFDMELALLRLAPEHRESALRDAKGLRGEFGAALRYALGSSEGEPIGLNAALWAAAARARSPWTDDPRVEERHPGLGPDAGLAARYVLRVGRDVPTGYRRPPFIVDRQPVASDAGWRDIPTLSLHDRRRMVGSDVSWAESVWPMVHDPLFATGAEMVAACDRGTMDVVITQPFFAPLLYPDVPLRRMGMLLLVTGLNATRAELSGLATDALIAAINDGRLDGIILGEGLAELARMKVEPVSDTPWKKPSEPVPPVPFVKLNRWAKVLGDAARTSPLHARVISRAISGVLRGDSSDTKAPPNLNTLLVLLKELLIETGEALSDPEARGYLTRLANSGKTGKLIHDLLELEAVPDHPVRSTAAAHALTRRVERAERWASLCRRSNPVYNTPGQLSEIHRQHGP